MSPTAAAVWLVLGVGTNGAPAASELGVGPPENRGGPPPAIRREVTGPTGVEAPDVDVVEPVEPAPSVDSKPKDDATKPSIADEPAPTKKPDRYAPWEKRYGGYAEMDLELTTIDDSFATILGGGVGFIVVKRFIVGASGYGLVFHDRKYPSVEGDRGLRMAWGGPTIGVYAVRRKVVESTASLLLAGGRGCLNFTTSDAQCNEATGLFVAQTEINIYFKLAKILRLGVGIGYRFVGAADWNGPGNWDIAGGYGSFKIALGRF